MGKSTPLAFIFTVHNGTGNTHLVPSLQAPGWISQSSRLCGAVVLLRTRAPLRLQCQVSRQLYGAPKPGTFQLSMAIASSFGTVTSRSTCLCRSERLYGVFRC